MGGAAAGRQYIAAGLVDEVQIHLGADRAPEAGTRMLRRPGGRARDRRRRRVSRRRDAPALPAMVSSRGSGVPAAPPALSGARTVTVQDPWQSRNRSRPSASRRSRAARRRRGSTARPASASRRRGRWSRTRSRAARPSTASRPASATSRPSGSPPATSSGSSSNLLRSHAAGAGEPLPEEVVRGMMLLLAASLARGHSGVRPGARRAGARAGRARRDAGGAEPRLGRLVGRPRAARAPRRSCWSARARRSTRAGGCRAARRCGRRGSSRSR